jgi:hypothetical protein
MPVDRDRSIQLVAGDKDVAVKTHRIGGVVVAQRVTFRRANSRVVRGVVARRTTSSHPSPRGVAETREKCPD